MVFPVVMYGCQSWTIKKAERRRIDAFELWSWRRLLRVSWTSRRSNPVNPKGNQSWIFIGRTDAEAETPILWASDTKNWLIGKDPDPGKDWRQKEMWMTVYEMVGWHHWLLGHEFGHASGFGDGQGGLTFMEYQRVGHYWANELNWVAPQCSVSFCYTKKCISHM